jgi:apolipoprotein N-acyltransferase
VAVGDEPMQQSARARTQSNRMTSPPVQALLEFASEPAVGYGRDATPLLAVPTNDWPSIRFAHFDNARLRAIENGYAIVRAASNGISAIVSPRGEVLVSEDHNESGPKLIVDDVPLGDGIATPYARFGDWPMLVLSLLAIALGWRRRVHGPRERQPSASTPAASGAVAQRHA